jgi:hypothetical protein
LLGWGGDAVEKLLQWFDQWPQVSETAGADCP